MINIIDIWLLHRSPLLGSVFYFVFMLFILFRWCGRCWQHNKNDNECFCRRTTYSSLFTYISHWIFLFLFCPLIDTSYGPLFSHVCCVSHLYSVQIFIKKFARTLFELNNTLSTLMTHTHFSDRLYFIVNRYYVSHLFDFFIRLSVAGRFEMKIEFRMLSVNCRHFGLFILECLHHRYQLFCDEPI